MAETVSPSQMIDVAELSVEAAVAALIGHAAEINASDLFLLSNETSMLIQVRHLGIVRPISVVSIDQGRRFLMHIKANAEMDVTERRRPGDGRWIYKNEDGIAVDLRINTVPTLFGEDFGIRLLMRESQMFIIESLGMMPAQRKNFQGMLDSPGGIVLITGPSGAGKTATLYAALGQLNNGTRKINTIEDPIEFTVDGLRQSQVNVAIGMSFADLLRSLLRQSPDVIMVGEIRDTETAETAVRAANSGHMVFSTLHAPVASAAIQSMRSLGVHPHFLSTSLRGVIAQRLVRTLCTQCRLEFDISDAPNTFDEVRPWLGPDEGRTFYAAKGCEACNGVGYAARTGVFELMNISRPIRTMIAEGAPARDLRIKSVEEGMLDFRKVSLLKVAQGITSTEEIFRVIPSEHLLMED